MPTNAKFTLIPAAYKTSKLYSPIPLNGDGDFTFTRTSDATRINKDGYVEVVGSNIPRLDYTNGSCPEFLMERASTNLLTYSEDLTQWSKFSSGGTTPVVSSNVDISPNGGLTADKIEFFNDGVGIVTRNATVDAAEQHSLSIWMKGEIGGEVVEIHFKNIQSQGLGSQSYTLTTDWVRYKLEDLTPLQASAGLQLRNASTTEGKTIFAWGGQVEEGINATSYIPTDSTTITRSIDRLDDLTAIDVSSDDWTLFIDADYSDLANSFGCISINDGDDDNNLRIMNIESSEEVRVTNRVAGTGVNNYNIFYSTWGYKLKIGIVSTDDGFDVYVNGQLASSATSGRIDMSTMTNIGFTDGAGDNFLGRLKDFRYYNSNLTQEELIKLTR